MIGDGANGSTARLEHYEALRCQLRREIREFHQRLDAVLPAKTQLQRVLANSYQEIIDAREQLLGLMLPAESFSQEQRL